MADRYVPTLRSLAENVYLPENDPYWQEGQEAIAAYNSPQAKWQRNYDYVLEKTGSPEKAKALADSIVNTERRQEITQLATAAAGPVLGAGNAVINLAKRTMAGTRAAETVAPKMLATRSPVNPATDYRLSSEQGQRIGPNRPPEALRPEIDMMYSPTGKNEFAPNVTTRSRLSQLGDESPLQADRIGEAQAAVRARQAHSEFLDELRAAGEGMPERGYRSPTAPPDVPPSRPMSVPEVAGEPRSPFLDMPAPGVRSRPPAPAPEPLQLGSSGSASGTLVDPLTGHAYQPRQFGPLSQSGSGSFSPVTRAEAVMPQRTVNIEELVGEARAAQSPKAPAALDEVAAPAADFEVGPWGARPKTESRGLPPGSTVMPPEPIAPAAPASAPPILAREAPIGSILGYGGLGTGAAIMASLSGGPSAPQRRPMSAADADSITAGYDAAGPDIFQQAAAERARNMYAIDDADRMNDARVMAAIRRQAIDDADRRMGGPSAGSGAGAANTARQTLSGSRAGASAPASAPAPAAPAESRGFLSNLISSAGKLYDPNYQKDMTSQKLFEEANRNPDDPAAFFRADKRWKEENPNYGQPQAEKRGGAVEQKPSKEAMLHKSLEIIHHMIRNR